MNASADRNNLYEILGVSKNSDDNEIKKQYRKLCLTHHPDKGGKAEEFQNIQKAYETLSDPQKRQIYDMTGSSDEQQQGFSGGGMGVDLGSIFSNMFGGMGGGMGMPFNPFDQVPGMPGRQKRHKPQPKVHEIPVSLHDFYYGKTIKIQFERQKFCKGCKGEGFATFQSCGSCGGSGVVQQAIMVGPGMHAFSRGPCESCKGKGKMGTGKCDECKGKKYYNQEKTLEIIIKPGMKKGDNLLFEKECSDDPNYLEPGDVHIFFTEADENIDVYRKENDLQGSCYITLKESLLGTTYAFKNHPKYKNEIFEIKIPKGTMNEEVITIMNEGMPKKNTNNFGNFQLKVNIVVSEEEKKVLEDKKEEIQKLFSS
jgi:DnaJ family protein A protein 2